MTSHKHECRKNIYDLAAYQRALDLLVSVYDVSGRFPRHELYGLTSQMRRAALSVCNNIAEGQGRLTFGERRQFLSQARGSLFEVESECVVANRLKFLPAADLELLRSHWRKAAAALMGYIRWVQKQESTRKPGNRETRQPD